MFEYISALGQWLLVLGQWLLGGIGVGIFVLLLGNRVQEKRRRFCQRRQHAEPDRRYTMKCVFRVTPEDFAEIKRAASAKGMTVSAYLRHRVFMKTKSSFVAITVPEDQELLPDKKTDTMH